MKETKDYKLGVGKPVTNKDLESSYQITNKETGVLEMETSVLPSALTSIDKLQTDLDAIRSKDSPPTSH